MILKKKLQILRRLEAGSLAFIMVLSLVLGSLVVKTVKTVFADEISFTQRSVGGYVDVYVNGNYYGDYQKFLYFDNNGYPAYCLGEGLTAASETSVGYGIADQSVMSNQFGFEAERIKNILRNGYPLNKDYWAERGITDEAQQYATVVALHAVLEQYGANGNTLNDPVLAGYGFLRDKVCVYDENSNMVNKTSMDVVGMIMELVYCGENTNRKLYEGTLYVNEPSVGREDTNYVSSWNVNGTNVKGSIRLSLSGLPDNSKVYINYGNGDEEISLVGGNLYNVPVNGNFGFVVKVRSPYASVTSDFGIRLNAFAFDYRNFDMSNSGNAFFTINENENFQSMMTIKTERVNVETGLEGSAQVSLDGTSLTINVTKSDSNNGVALEGAVYGVYRDSACSDLVDSITTDANGKGSLEGLVWGAYYVKEITAPEGYELDETVYTVESDSNLNVTVSNSNLVDIPKVKIQVVKSDAYTNVKIEGAVYGIYADAECANLVQTLPATDTNGEAVSDYISQGTYYVKEISAPEHYDISDTVYTIDTSVNPNLTSYIFDQSVTELAQGQIEVTKLDEFTRVPLSGAVYGIYADENCSTLLETLPATDANGVAICSGWYSEGTYYLKEITAPEGYALSNTVTSFTTGGITKLAHATVTDVAKGSLKIYKIDNNTTVLLPGAVFELYSDLECTKLLERMPATDINGETQSQLYPIGTYYFREVVAPEHYDLDPTVYRISLGGTDILVEKTVTNKHKGQISIIKQDKNDPTKVLEGAVYGIYSDEKCTSLVEEFPATDSEGKAISSELNVGTYYLKEISAPEGYDLDLNVYETKTGDDTIILDVVVKDEKQGHIKIVKTEESDKDEFVAGAVYGIYSKQTCTTEELVMQLDATDENGVATGDVLPMGTYYLKEISAPEGYVLSEKVYKVAVNSEKESTVEVDNKAQVGYIQVFKYGEKLVDYKDGQFVWEEGYIAGAEFEIYDKDGNVVDTLTSASDGPVQSNALRLGTYTIKETKAPNGHIIDVEPTEIVLSIGDNIQTFVTKDYENTNTRQKFDLVINKLNQNTSTPIADVEFSLYANENICDANGNILIKSGELIATVVTDSNGYARFTTDLPHAKYMLYETMTPDAFVPLSEGIEIDYTDTFGYDETYMDTKVIKNKPKYGEDEDSGFGRGKGEGEVGSDVPNTGDPNKIRTVVIMMIISAFVFFGSVISAFITKKRALNTSAPLTWKKY